MKRNLQIAAGLAVFGSVLYLLQIRTDYRWADANIAQKETEGWTLAATSDNFADPTHPWTLFRAPVTSLWFVRPAERVTIAPSVFVIPEVSLRYDFDKTEQIENLVAHDVRNHRSAIISAGVSASQVNTGSLDWRVYEKDTPGAKIQSSVEAAITNHASR